jgi:hypothetical protein
LFTEIDFFIFSVSEIASRGEAATSAPALTRKHEVSACHRLIVTLIRFDPAAPS